MEVRQVSRGSPRKSTPSTKCDAIQPSSSDSDVTANSAEVPRNQPPSRQSSRIASAPNLQVSSLTVDGSVSHGNSSRSSSPRPSGSSSPRSENLDQSADSEESGNVRRRSSRLLNATKVEETNNNGEVARKGSESGRVSRSSRSKPEVKIVVHGTGEPIEVQSGISNETHAVVMLNKNVANETTKTNKINAKSIMAPAEICQALRAKLAKKVKPTPVEGEMIEMKEENDDSSDRVLGTLQIDRADPVTDPDITLTQPPQTWKEISQLDDLSSVHSVIKIIGYTNSQLNVNNNEKEGESYLCNFCDKEVSSKELLLDHVEKIHTIKCPQCSYLDFTRSGILSHCKLLHPELNSLMNFPILVSDTRWLPHARPAFKKTGPVKSTSKETSSQSSSQKSSAKFHCSQCRKSAGTSFQIVQHVKKAHPYSSAQVIGPDGENWSDVPPEKSRKIAVAKRSASTIPIIKQCKKLTSAAVSEMSKDAVIVLADPEEVPKELRDISSSYKLGTNGVYRCLKCPFKEPVRSRMQRHVIDKHAKTKVWSCPHCSYEARKKYQLIVHLLVKHVGEEFKVIRRLPYSSDHITAASKHAENSTSEPPPKTPPKPLLKPPKKAVPKKPAPLSPASPEKNSEAAKTYQTPDGLEVKIYLAENMPSELVNIHTSYHRLSSGMFRCKKCSVKKDDKYKIEDHVRIHFSSKVWSCAHCNVGKSKKLEVIAHMRKAHPGKEFIVIRNKPYAVTSTPLSPKKENNVSDTSKKKESNATEYKKASTSQPKSEKSDSGNKKRSEETPTIGLQKLKVIERNERKIELLLTNKIPNELQDFHQKYRMLKEHEGDRSSVCETCGVRKDRTDRMERHIMDTHITNLFIWHCAHCREKFNMVILATEHALENHNHEPLKLIRQFPYAAISAVPGKETKTIAETEPKDGPSKKIVKKSSGNGIVTTEIHRTVSTAEIVMMKEIPLSWTMDVTKYYTSMGAGSYLCKKCDYCTKNEQYIDEHVRMRHFGAHYWQCAYCSTGRQRQGEVEKHISEAHPSKPLKVVRCKPYKYKTDNAAAKIESVSPPIQATGRVTKPVSNIVQSRKMKSKLMNFLHVKSNGHPKGHVQHKSSEGDESPRNTDSESSDSDSESESGDLGPRKLYLCTICGRKDKSSELISTHISAVHDISDPSKIKEISL